MINTCIIALTIGCILIVFLTILIILLIFTGKFDNKRPLNCKGIRPPSPSQLKEKAKKEKYARETKSLNPKASSAFAMASLGQKPVPQAQNNNKS
jgi:hypothetical protein